MYSQFNIHGLRQGHVTCRAMPCNPPTDGYLLHSTILATSRARRDRGPCREDKEDLQTHDPPRMASRGEATIPVLCVRYRERGASIAQTSRLRMVLRKAERERDAVANEVRGLCRG